MLIVHELPGVWDLPSASPFCLKLTTWLRMADIPYESRPSAAPLGAPRRKAPWVEEDGKKLADSGHIVAHLTVKHRVKLDAHLSDRDFATAHLLRRTLEESLYFAILHQRWMTKDGWAILKPAYFSALPPGMRSLVPPMARRQVRAYLHGQGMGRHTHEEIDAHAVADLRSALTVLGDRAFFFDQPSAIDAVAYAFFANALLCPVPSKLRDEALGSAALNAYCDRMKARYWKDAA